LPATDVRLLNVAGVPRVRHRDGGQAMRTALPITSLIGTVLEIGLQLVSPTGLSESGRQCQRESAESVR